MKIGNLILGCCFFIGFSFAQTDITSVEYFFDADPGVGNGILIDVNPNVSDLNQTFSISTSGLSTGTHQLFMRSFNEDGEVSSYVHKTFRVGHAFDNNSADIVEAEYFIDQDPGVGMGVTIDVVDGALVDETINVPTNSLSVGTHRLFVRTRNSNNVYSLYEHKTFRLGHAFDNNTADIVEAEYFIDQDPGVGMGGIIDVVDGAIVDETLNIPTTSLSVGTHRLFVRTKNADNTYSLYEHKTFRLGHTFDNNSVDIVEAEYFIDQDPGVGMGMMIDVVDGTIVDETLNIPTTSLSAGTHRLFVRTKNANNTYSLYEHKVFRLGHLFDNNSADIIAAEYFVDVDPGYGNANALSVSGNTIDETVMALTAGSLSQGTHYLYIRTQNMNGDWSLYERKEFDIDGTLGIDDEELAKIGVYPNPTQSFINIETPLNNDIEAITIYDLQGKEVLRQKQNTNIIDISSFENGVYLLVIISEKGSVSKKIIKY